MSQYNRIPEQKSLMMQSAQNGGQASLFDMNLGEVMKQRGITLALRNANEQHESWGERAYNYLKAFIKDNPTFRAEQARAYAESQGLEEPKSKRAFGAVILRAAKAGIIKKIGHDTVENPKAHRCFASLWEAI